MFRSVFGRRHVGTTGLVVPEPDPDQAWRILGLVNEWIRHSDAKAGITLAFTGALATMLFNLVKGYGGRSLLFDVLVVLTAIMLVLTVVLCGWTLTPRVDDPEAETDAVSRLYFGSIAASFKGARQPYRDAVSALTADPAELVRDLSDQIHVNARIAAVKTKYAKRAIWSALAAGGGVGALASLIGINSF